jgi:predicted secreted hydrolase
MSANRRWLQAIGCAGVILGLSVAQPHAQGFSDLGASAEGFAPVVRGVPLTFPTDNGPHLNHRIEWWYVTANLRDANQASYGVQWTLFRQASEPGEQKIGWANQQTWMGHVAVTSAQTHRYSEAFARGGIGQAGVEAQPFKAWIDNWELRSDGATADGGIGSLELKGSGSNFGYALRLKTDKPAVLQGENGYSQKSERGQASYYYSQPYFQVTGSITIDDKTIEITGQAWMDREWSSQPLSPEQKGWDWFSLHLESGEKLMLFRLREAGGRDYLSGNWISKDGASELLAGNRIALSQTKTSPVQAHDVPVEWTIEIPTHGLKVQTVPVNSQSWMGTSVPYWEGPIRITGSHPGVGYLEMTGY